jgi:hypothetical protein
MKARGWMGGYVDGDDVEGQLNALGADGWELVATTTTQEGYGSSRFLLLVMKRREA